MTQNSISKKTLGIYALLTLTALFWGGNAVAGKLAFGNISPMLLTMVRWGLASAIMAIIGSRHVRAEWVELKKHMLLLAAYGVFGFSLFNIALYSALQYTTAINVTIQQAAIPIIIMAANFALFKMRVYKLQIAGFVLSVLGVIVTITQGEPSRLIALELNRGDALALLSIMLYGGYAVALRYKPKLHWKSLLCVMSFTAFLGAIPFALWEYVSGTMVYPTTQGWLVSVYAAIFPSILSQAFFIYGVSVIGANRAGLFINIVPIAGAILSIIILGERLQAFHIVGFLLVLSGIALAEHKKRKL